MLKSVHLTDYRCFRDVELRLGPLTAIVGPNASGKTALLRAMTAAALWRGEDVWQRKSTMSAEIAWRTDTAAFGAKWNAQGTHLLNMPLEGGQYLHFDLDSMRAAQPVAEKTRLSSDGGNLTSLFATLSRRVQERLANDLCKLVPVLADVTLRPTKENKQRLVFQDRWNADVWYEPSEVSDGTILTLGLLALQYQEASVTLVAIEEPERGLHPYLLGELVTILRKLATGEVGRKPMQVVLATQSAELLEFLEPDEVRFLNRRSEDGAVVIEEVPSDTEEWREAYAAHQESLGNAWLSGSLGGIPTG